MENITFQHLYTIEYKQAWDLQEKYLAENLEIKKRNRDRELKHLDDEKEETKQYFFLCEHLPVFTLGKSGHIENLLVNNEYLKTKRNFIF
ncbi:MAG: Octanoyltransferase [Bacteroidetes bacterium OLB11]|nr:MAG: Octanoyltransferase [Bacteroidetes bacterium OLB11]